MYIALLKELAWPNPFVSSATGQKAEFSGPSGMKMLGPYEYVPPVYWYVDKTHGGAYGFNTETGPGPAVPPLESLKRMLPAEHLWPIDEFWNFHAGGGEFKDLKVFTKALNERYGPAEGVADYALKAQAVAYESHRAMFEAFAKNKYLSTGVIQWMLNNAWPSMIWHLYDFYLQPGGAYFGAKKACEPLHIQYSYDDRSIVVTNSSLETYRNLRAKAAVYNLDATEKFAKTELLHVTPDSSQLVFTLPEINDLSTTYFLKLALEDSKGKIWSRNIYWLSTQPDVLDDPQSTWFYTPQKAYGDFKALQTLPQPGLQISSRHTINGKEGATAVIVKNSSPHLAFFLRLKLKKGVDGDEVLPVLWEDNYVTLLPGEQQEIKAVYAIKDLEGKKPAVEVVKWGK
jgi:exo-1,4-beta-D-glucosaminidase